MKVFAFANLNISVDRCRPYFLSLIGDRYGWAQVEGVPDEILRKSFENASINFPWINQYEDRSITELEIRHAGTVFELNNDF